MPTFDSGRCFLTALLPIQTSEVVDEAGLRSSHVHMVRDALSILPTAHQSPVTERLKVISPFAKCDRTHFARIAVIDEVIFNGRMATDALFDRSDRTIPKPVDQLPGPYLMVVIDFDAPQGTVAELRDYLCNVWSKMGKALEPIFKHCFGFKENMEPDAFADFIIRCQVETTMPFNDYWPGLPPLQSLSLTATVAAAAGAFAVGAAVLFAGLSMLNLPVPVPVAWSWAFVGLVVTTLLATLAAATYVIRQSLVGRTTSTGHVALIGLAVWVGTLALLLSALNLLLPEPIDYSWSVLFEIVGIDVVLLVAAIPAAYAAYLLVMSRGARPLPMAPNSNLPSILKALHVQREFIAFATRTQGQGNADLFAEFGKFLGVTRVGDPDGPNGPVDPTQSPGRIT